MNACNLKKQKEANEVFYAHYTALSKNARTRSGLRDVLRWLEKQDYDRTILSNYVTEEIQKQLHRLKINHYFSHVCGNGDGTTVLHRTTKAERLSEYMRKRG